MTTTTIFTVNGMTCGHCVAAVDDKVSKLDLVTSVSIELATGEVTVESDGPVDPRAFVAAVAEAGYDVAP